MPGEKDDVLGGFAVGGRPMRTSGFFLISLA